MENCIRAIGLLFVAALAATEARSQSLRYTVSPVTESGVLKGLNVEMTLRGEDDGETEIELPDDWGGKTDLWRGIVELSVSGQGASVVARSDPARRVIRHTSGAKLSVRYRVIQFWPGEPAASGSNEYRPVMRPGYFHLIGWTIFARPRWTLATPVSVSFVQFPKEWSFASDLEHGEQTLADALQSVTVGGDFRLLKAGALRVAIRGVWPFPDDVFMTRLEPIIASHHRFWGDPPGAYLVTVLPLASQTGHLSIGGTNLGDAFAFFATSNASERQLIGTLAHEHLHSWIPRRVGTMPQDNDAAEYWFSEGFVEFYTYRLLMRDALLPVEEVVRAVNGVMWAYAFSPAHNAPNTRITTEFWSDPAVNKLPYQRGFLLAALADSHVRRASGNKRDLDDVMLEMKRVAGSVNEGVLAPPVRNLFIASMRSESADIADEIERYIERGETIVLPDDVWAGCGALATSDVAEFDRGFDGRRTIANNNIATGVDPNGPAYAAGLRNGMRILKLDLSEGGDSRVALTLRVHVNGATSEITYLPAGKRKVKVQELILDLAGRDACAARLGGLG